MHRKDQLHPVQFPDVSPTKAKPKGGFNMVAGDFLQVIFSWRSAARRLWFMNSNRKNQKKKTKSILFICLWFRCIIHRIIGIALPRASSSTAQIMLPSSLRPYTSKYRKWISYHMTYHLNLYQSLSPSLSPSKWLSHAVYWFVVDVFFVLVLALVNAGMFFSVVWSNLDSNIKAKKKKKQL